MSCFALCGILILTSQTCKAVFHLQVENEYGDMERNYGDGGKRYALWAANMAVSLNTGVPWIMCQQYDAPDPVVRVVTIT